MEKLTYYKYVFIIAAIYIFINTIVFFFASIFIPETIFALFGAIAPPSLIWLHISLFLIFTFGIGYIIVSRDLSKNHGIVVIGAMVKTEFFVITLIYYLIGDMNIMIVLLGGIDILFVCLFIEFLLKYKQL